MQFRILGPLEVTHHGQSLELGYAKQQTVLGALLLNANEVIGTARLIDELWGDAPPASAPKLVQGYVSGLRKVLGRDTILTRAGGYVVRVEPGQLDAARFHELAATARACRRDAEDAATRFEDALSLWRGRPLEGLVFRASARHELEGLAEQRLVVLEQRIDADLARGRNSELVAELCGLVAEYPFRERPRGQLMLALFRSGRQAEALEAYRDGHRMLAERLALEPSAPLRDLERQILRHDPALRLPPRVPEPLAKRPLATRAPPAHLGRGRRRILLAAALAGVLAAAISISIWSRGQGSPAARGPVGNSVAVLDPQSGRLVADIALGIAPGDVAAGAGAVWVANPNDGAITRIEPISRTIRQTIRVRTGPAAIAVGAGAVWVTNSFDGTMSKVSPETNEVVQTIRVGNGPTGVAVGAGSVWVVNRDDHTVSRIDPRDGHVRKTVGAGADPADIAAGAGAIWVTNRSRGEVLKLDPATGRVVDAVNVGRGPAAVAVAHDSVWVANALDATVSRVDPSAAVVRATVPVDEGPTALAAGFGAVWAAHEGGSVARIDPATGAAARSIRLGRPLAGIAAGADGLYVSSLPSGSRHSGGTLRVLSTSGSIQSVDPATAYDVISWTVLDLTHDGLTAFKRVPGSAGAQLVPNLARSLPEPADGGRTYTFRVRDGIRYASGDAVRPTDFRRAIERAFSSRSPAVPLYAALEGASRCARRPRECDLSAGVIADDQTGTVTFHLTEPDPELPEKLALPPAMPASRAAPGPGRARRPPTGTGAYTVASYVPRRQLRLVRNSGFHEWSRAARPAGVADEIVIELGVSVARQVRDVARGDADVAWFPPVEMVARLRERYTSRLHSNPRPSLWYLGLNSHAEPFDDVRVRRALNHAIDRDAFVRSVGGAFVASATCQILPPGLPGHRPYCPYPHDLAKARQLVAASGTRGARVTVWSPRTALMMASPAVSALKALGYRARLRLVGENEPWIDELPRRVVVQAAAQAWVADYPSASIMVHPFTCGATSDNLPSFCDRAIDRAIDEGLELKTRDPHAAGAVWARVDRMIVDRAAAVPLANARRVDFLSERAGNYQYHPLAGMLLDQLWVR